MTYEELTKTQDQRWENIVRHVRYVTGRRVGTRCRDREQRCGDTAIRNYEKWKDIRINMDTLCANKKVDTSLNIFGKSFRYPFLRGRSER